ncbi:hypothetical protein SAMN05421858_1469 [Haladaptatus litoreus]|uniref:DUF8141 domain-containing protein n=1 Tax=Haladaptatus litoreus TaxID=553468 RepID=A0A1N6Y9H0_9EURY|nr:hypothetical protein [Haladaptatus litoreus]SIR11228.1 hypothetical protein SAMN05421858_1469 [Haladaptatus litoreus]
MSSAISGKQLVVAFLLADVVGLTAGYLLHSPLGTDPIMGAVYGLIAANVPVSLWMVMQNSQ